MTTPKKPRPGGSRPSVGRPRKVAGQRTEPDPVVEEGALAPVSKPPEEETSAGGGGFETGLRPSSTTDPSPRRRLRRVLIAATGVLVLALLVEAGLMLYYRVIEDEPKVSAERPVATGELSHRAAVEAAARATEEILSTTYEDYDEQTEQATAKMTDAFAKEYRETADGLADKYAEQQLTLQVKAVAQGVVQASSEQVEALLFLNQYVEKVQDGEPATAFSQYRALVTVVRTDQGWLVSDIETK